MKQHEFQARSLIDAYMVNAYLTNELVYETQAKLDMALISISYFDKIA